MNQPEYPYKLARFVSGSPRSYIEFYVWNIDKNRLVRKRDYTINKYVGTKQFDFQRDLLISDINELLLAGHVTQDEDQDHTPKIKTMRQAIAYVKAKKKKTTRKRTGDAYNTLEKHLVSYLNGIDSGLLDKHPGQIEPKIIRGFNDYLILNPEFKSNHSIKNIAILCKSFWNSLKDSDIIETVHYENPKNLSITESRNQPFNDEQMKQIRSAIADSGDDQFLLYVDCLFYTMARPDEIRKLRYSEVDLTNRVIHLPAEVSKNRISRTIEITEPFYQVLKPVLSHLQDQTPPNEPIFKARTTQIGDFIGVNYFRKRFSELRDQLGLSADFTLYSIKHYSVIKHFLAGFDIRWIMDQTGHQDMKSTCRYLRSLGLKSNRASIEPPTL